MAVSHSPAIERIARVLAGEALSANAHGDARSAADAVDERWKEYEDRAVAILRALREPDADMAVAGDAATWEAMIRAALGSHAA
jgi:hypothetical protein